MKIFVPPAAAPAPAAKTAPISKIGKPEATPAFQRVLDSAAEREAKPPARKPPAPSDAPAGDASEEPATEQSGKAQEPPSADASESDEAVDVGLTPQPGTTASTATTAGASAQPGTKGETADPKLAVTSPPTAAAPAASTPGAPGAPGAPHEASPQQAITMHDPSSGATASHDQASAPPLTADAAVKERASQPPVAHANPSVAVPDVPTSPTAAQGGVQADLHSRGASAEQNGGQVGAQSGAVEAQELPNVDATASASDSDTQEQNDSSDQRDRGQAAKAPSPPQSDAASAMHPPAGVAMEALAGVSGDESNIASDGPALDAGAREITVQPHEKAAIGAKSAAEQTASTVRDEQRVAEQAMRAMRTMINQRGGSLTLRLNPPELGELRIRLEMQQHTVTARFEAANEMVRQLLQQQLPQLHSALSGHGLTVEQIQVQVQGQHGGSNPQGSDGQDQPNDGRSRGSFDQTPERRQQRQRDQLTRFARELLDVVG